MEEIKKWLEEQVYTVLPKSPLGQAISYTLSRWAGLSAYAMHGQMEIDNAIGMPSAQLGRKCHPAIGRR